MWDVATSYMGITSLINMILSIVFITVSWWTLQAFKFDLFIRNMNSPQAKLLQLLLSIAIGHTVARFFIDYMQWTSLLRYII